MTDFHELYTKYAGDIYRFALFLSGNSVDAEDITAETFVRAITGKSPLVSATVKGYLLTIAKNLFLESVRRRKKLSELTPAIPCSGPDPEDSVSLKNELENLQEFLQTFSEVDRAALLFRADGLSYNEIAGALNISLASAKVKVHRMRLKLAEWRMNCEMKENEIIGGLNGENSEKCCN
ncbi:MAG: sigma-70 family RNA polymerase sigma factor [Melioribacteraceae bacterium]|nr:sigma-70 family RNA polymerase sigma factor [Melioribacteraceae bacterium]